MIKGAVGDFIGSFYEGCQWNNKEQELIGVSADKTFLIKSEFNRRVSQSITDDTICSLGLLKAYVLDNTGEDAAKTLSCFCKQFKEVGFGSRFEAWIDNPIPYGSFANGCLMRLGFLEYVPEEDRLKYAIDYTLISHNHDDSIESVRDYVSILNNFDKLEEIALKREVTKSVEDYHNDKKFIISAKETLNQAIAVLRESDSFEDILRNCMYIGGDTDTLAAIACEISPFDVPQYLIEAMEDAIIFGTEETFKEVLKTIEPLNV